MKQTGGLRHGLLDGRSSAAHVRGLCAVEGVDEGVGVLQEGDVRKVVAAAARDLAVEGDTLAADVEAGGAAGAEVVHRRGDVATAGGVEAERAADGVEAARAVCCGAEALVKVEDLHVVVDLRAGREAQAELERRRVVDLDAVLVDLHVRLVVEVVLAAEEARARVEDALDAEEGLHALVELRAVDDADRVGVLSVQGGALRRVGVGHERFGSYLRGKRPGSRW